MNSIWNKNLKLFEQRFPALAPILSLKEYDFSRDDCEIKIQAAKNGQTTALVKGLPLHSKYDPLREAESYLSKIDENKTEAIIFFSFGLGYAPLLAARKFHNKGKDCPAIILIEKDKHYLEAALSVLDFEEVFKYEKLLFIIDAEEKDAESLLPHFNKENAFIYSVTSQKEHAKEYFSNLESFLEKNTKKEEINNATLEKFAHLWLRNSLKNIHWLYECDGVKKYFGLGADLPFTILAAGPSLKKILPFLKEIKERSVVIAVDTSLHACLKAGVEPDFIIIMDPQYYCARHLDFLSSPSSILICENAVYPSVFNFKCREKVLCTSMFPSGQYFERKIGIKGILKAGGSVTTSAWDFARACGTKEIYIAGMDLGYPGKETHVRGSQFEEKIHCLSNRFSTAEKDNITSLLSAGKILDKDYEGNDLITDEKMSVFRWWFEKAAESGNLDGQKTYSLTKESLFIKNIEFQDINYFLSKPSITDKKNNFFSKAEQLSEKKQKDYCSREQFKEIYLSFENNLKELKSLGTEALTLVKKAENNKGNIYEINQALGQIDSKIINSSAKDAASLVFPTAKQLEKLLADVDKNSPMASIQSSRIIYGQLLKAVNEYLQLLERYRKLNIS